ncbi:ATPase family associated with various cellular activities (AAA) domain-containing protein [Ditylenchus destructor]|nr:ATPase family associated with various cellular activities (AAA) domain-containing protein [Ditylenchus destructor]
MESISQIINVPLAAHVAHGNTTQLSGFDLSSIVAFYTTLLCNPVFFGSLAVTIIGFIGYYLNSAYNTVKDAFWQRFIRTLDISNKYMEYQWVMDHINKHSTWQTANLSLESKLDYDDLGNGYMDRKFLPGEGTHYFYYKNQWIQVDRRTEKAERNSGERDVERVTLTTYGYNVPPDFWQNFLDEASREAIEAMSKGLSLYRADYEYWSMIDKPRKKRTLDSVILADGVKERLTEDIQDFLDSESWYNEMGVPYRRGYLLYGPPGTGKTSIVTALASHFGFNICIVSLNDIGMTDSTLSKLLNDPPNRSFILLEDIDAAFVKRDKDEEEKETKKKKKSDDDSDSDGDDDEPKCKRSSVTLSGMLNALDGVASCEERIVFMTTNHKDRLDSALIRPGRVDCEQFVGHCTTSVIEKMFKRFYKWASEEQYEEFIKTVGTLESTISPAQLQRHFTRYKNRPEAAIENYLHIQ